MIPDHVWIPIVVSSVLIPFLVLRSQEEPAGINGWDGEAMYVVSDAAKNWWAPSPQVLELNRRFERAYRLGQGGIAHFFAKALEAEIAKPDGADAGAVTTAANVLGWSGDIGATGILERVLFATNNPSRAQTFVACVMAAQKDAGRLARIAVERTSAEERRVWYHALSHAYAPRIAYTEEDYNRDSGWGSGEEHKENDIYVPTEGDCFVRGYYRRENYFLAAALIETNAACAMSIDIALFMSPPQPHKLFAARLISAYWDVVRRPLAEKFKDTGEAAGEYFSEILREGPDAYYRKSRKAEVLSALKRDLVGLLRAKPPFADNHSHDEHRRRIQEKITALELNGASHNEIHALIHAIPNDYGIEHPLFKGH